MSQRRVNLHSAPTGRLKVAQTLRLITHEIGLDAGAGETGLQREATDERWIAQDGPALFAEPRRVLGYGVGWKRTPEWEVASVSGLGPRHGIGVRLHGGGRRLEGQPYASLRHGLGMSRLRLSHAGTRVAATGRGPVQREQRKEKWRRFGKRRHGLSNRMHEALALTRAPQPLPCCDDGATSPGSPGRGPACRSYPARVP